VSASGEPTAVTSLRGETTLTEPNRYERTRARRSAEIRATVPDAEFAVTIDVGPALRRAAEADVPLTALVLAATAQALVAVPRLNGAYRDGRFELYSRVNIGVTIAAEGVYVVPTIFDSDKKSASDLAAELADYRERAGADRLESAELAGATFTVTDLSHHHIEVGAPLVIGGQAGGLATGAVRAAPVVREAEVVPGHEMVLSLATDHRMVQAPDAGRFLAAISATLGGA
jgi:pyruvate dehydrogenase E2 component (dihydrolipoamide acetyltransferase)